MSSGVLDQEPGACDERCKVETVPRTGSLFVGLQTARCAFDEPRCPNVVAPRLMRQAHAQLCQALPQLAFLTRARLPPDLQGLVRRERTSFVQQTAGVRQSLRGRKRFLGDWLDALRAIWQGASESVAWSSLLRAPMFVSIAIADHVKPASRPYEARRRGCSDHTWLPTLSSGSGARRQPVTPSASFSSVIGASSGPTSALTRPRRHPFFTIRTTPGLPSRATRVAKPPEGASSRTRIGWRSVPVRVRAAMSSSVRLAAV